MMDVEVRMDYSLVIALGAAVLVVVAIWLFGGFDFDD